MAVADRLVGTLEDFPHVTEEGVWTSRDDLSWMSGYWVGLLWLRYLERPSERVMVEARRWLARLASAQHRDDNVDACFVFESSFVRGFRISGDRVFRDVGVQAARSLAARFQAGPDALDRGEPAGSISVDCTAGLSLLAWADPYAVDAGLESIARRTSRTLRTVLIRKDGSTRDIALFPVMPGSEFGWRQWQAASQDSCWARGHALAVYGFLQLGLLTDDQGSVEIAARLADFALRSLPVDALPYWDLMLPNPEGEPRDASAAAILASALIDLGDCVPDPPRQRRYRAGATRLLLALADSCLADDEPEPARILRYGSTGLSREGRENESSMVADHFFVEALTKLLRPDRRRLLDAAGDRAVFSLPPV
ncbi:MAG: hypothetical protein U0821_01995 [Chloroflexota bacterium]